MAHAMLAALAVLVSNSQINTAVAELGPSSDYRSVERIAAYGCRAVPALVRQLELVDKREIRFLERFKFPREMRTIWTIATLRYITGRDFYANIDYKVTDSPRQQMLTLGAPKGKSKAFGIWMSRGVVYFTDRPSQAKIIAQWKEYVRSGACSKAGQKAHDEMFWLYGVPS